LWKNDSPTGVGNRTEQRRALPGGAAGQRRGTWRGHHLATSISRPKKVLSFTHTNYPRLQEDQSSAEMKLINITGGRESTGTRSGHLFRYTIAILVQHCLFFFFYEVISPFCQQHYKGLSPSKYRVWRRTKVFPA